MDSRQLRLILEDHVRNFGINSLHPIELKFFNYEIPIESYFDLCNEERDKFMKSIRSNSKKK